jgi:hypothetical protein
MRSLVFLLLFCVGCAGCKDCNKVDNPISKDYPCGTRAHPCSMSPLMCCYVGESFMASPSAMPSASAAPGAKFEPQWSIGTR